MTFLLVHSPLGTRPFPAMASLDSGTKGCIVVEDAAKVIAKGAESNDAETTARPTQSKSWKYYHKTLVIVPVWLCFIPVVGETSLGAAVKEEWEGGRGKEGRKDAKVGY